LLAHVEQYGISIAAVDNERRITTIDSTEAEEKSQSPFEEIQYEKRVMLDNLPKPQEKLVEDKDLEY